MGNELTKQEKEELEKLKNEIIDEAKKVVENYVDNPTDISGSVVNIHQNSPFLDSNVENGYGIFGGKSASNKAYIPTYFPNNGWLSY